jgi:transcriptional regulator with XRE-family HTH domain
LESIPLSTILIVYTIYVYSINYFLDYLYPPNYLYNMVQKRPRTRIQRVYSLIGSQIKLIRQKKGISQEDLAKRAGLTRPSIVLIENGSQRLPIDRLYNIAKALQTSPTHFFPEIKQVFDEGTIANSETAPMFVQGGNDLKPKDEKQIREKLKEIRSGGSNK